MSAFDRARYDETLAEVGDMLGELWAIDELVRWVRANPEGDHLYANGPYPRIRIGVTEPFDFEAPEDSWGPLLTSGRNWSDQVVESIRSLTWDIVRTESAPFDAAVDAIRASVVSPLKNFPDNFADLDNNLSAWNGDAADAFGDWYARMEFIGRKQAFAAEYVCTGIAASKAVVDLGQQSVQNVVDSMHATLYEQLVRRHDTLGLPPDNSAYTALVLGSALFGLLAAIPTAGTSLGVGITLVTAASATSTLLGAAADTLPAEGTTERTASLGTAEQIFHELSEAISEVRDDVRRGWQAVEDTVSGLIAVAGSSVELHELAPTRPSIVRRDPTPDGFHHESAPR